VSKRSSLLVAVASLLLLAAFFVPLWRVSLLAPQYPEGLGLLIHIDRVTGIKPNDLQSINGLNHYIGMKPIDADAIPDLKVMPWLLSALVIGGLVVAAARRRALLYGWLIAFFCLGVAGVVDFWRWEYDFGHDLDLEHAIIKVPGMTYQPPLIGTKQLLNFTASSWPAAGAICLGLAFALGVAAVMIARRAESRGAVDREVVPLAASVAAARG
jgi:hypothetical protein